MKQTLKTNKSPTTMLNSCGQSKIKSTQIVFPTFLLPKLQKWKLIFHQKFFLMEMVCSDQSMGSLLIEIQLNFPLTISPTLIYDYCYWFVLFGKFNDQKGFLCYFWTFSYLFSGKLFFSISKWNSFVETILWKAISVHLVWK